MRVSSSSSTRLSKRGYLFILAGVIICVILLDTARSESVNLDGSGEKEDGSLKPRPTLPMLGAFFHIQKPGQVKRAFIKYKIIPDVIDEAPKGVLRVLYSTKKGLVAKFGNVMNPTELTRRPRYLSWPTEKDSFYTVFMFDPDAVPYPRAAWLHWFVVNIKLDRLSTGFHVAKYLPPRPKKGSGLHRIVCLAYKQPLGDLFYNNELFYNDTRYNFTIETVLKKYHYERPVAGNFFQVQWMKPIPTKKPKTKSKRTTPAEEYDYGTGKFYNGTI